MATQLELSREVEFPTSFKTASAKKKYKEKLLTDNPDILYCDYIFNKGKKIKNNLIFHTNSIPEWKTIICKKHKFTVREGVGRGGRIIICSDGSLDTDNPVLTVTYYTKGTFLLQGNEASLISFEEMFDQMKAEVSKEKACATVDQKDTEQKSSQCSPLTAAPPSPPSHTQPPQPAAAPPPSPSQDRQLRESLALLELDFTEFRVQTQAKLQDTSSSNVIQQLREEVQQLRADISTITSAFRSALKEVQDDNKELRKQVSLNSCSCLAKEISLFSLCFSRADSYRS